MGLWAGTQSSAATVAPRVSRTDAFAPANMSTVSANQNVQTKTKNKEEKSSLYLFHMWIIIPRFNHTFPCSQYYLSLGQSPNPIKLKQEQRLLAPRFPTPSIPASNYL